MKHKRYKIPNALSRVRKYFPQVNKVTDARDGVIVRVTEADAKQGRKKDPSGCALARACVREKKADGAIIGIAFSWLINGTVATRYKTTETVAREITSFDRHQDFASGKDYLLSRVSPGSRLGKKQWPMTGPHKTGRVETARIHNHRTANIRVL